jgi:hypothetical protein
MSDTEIMLKASFLFHLSRAGSAAFILKPATIINDLRHTSVVTPNNILLVVVTATNQPVTGKAGHRLV